MYPNSALAAWQVVMMAAVVVVALGIWLTAVFLAAREPGDRPHESEAITGAADDGIREQPARRAA